MIAYVDSSVLVGLLFNEPLALALKPQLKDKELVSSNLLEAELLSATAREKASWELCEQMLQTISLIFPERSLVSELSLVYSYGYSRGADAFHLACAMYLSPQPNDLPFFSLDKKQKQLATKLGFT